MNVQSNRMIRLFGCPSILIVLLFAYGCSDGEAEKKNETKTMPPTSPTPSVEAVEAFNQGNKIRQTDKPGAIAAYTRTIQADPKPNVRQVAATYRTLRAMTKEPVFVDPGLARLCIGASQAKVEAARKASGPHAHTAVSIFMNDAAADAFGKPKGTYPVGSIVVKEKSALGYRSATQPGEWSKANDGVGGMIKRLPGYDPAHGDWEYFYFEDVNKIESGKIDSCVQCHRGAAGKDYVFGGWVGGG